MFQERTTNWFGGESLLAIVNAPTSQSTGVPRAWGDKQRAIQIIGKVTARYGYEAPRLDTYDLWSDEDRIRELGGPTPETQVIVSGRALGPAGQWLSFTFQDPSKDKEGRFDERLWPTDGSFGQPNTLMLSYGANGLLHEADREEFKKRMEPFKDSPCPLRWTASMHPTTLNHQQLIGLLSHSDPGFVAGDFATRSRSASGPEGETGSFRYFPGGFWEVTLDGGGRFLMAPWECGLSRTQGISRKPRTGVACRRVFLRGRWCCRGTRPSWAG